jgi:hypothetical protein
VLIRNYGGGGSCPPANCAHLLLHTVGPYTVANAVQQIVDANGNVQGQWLQSGELLLGNATGTNTSIGKVGLLGSTSGTVTMQVAAAAGTYNFNLPATVGAAGNPLLSQAGGATSMIWATGTTLDASGNITSTGTIRANTGFNINGAAGVSQTCTVNTASPLTLIFTNGILTGGTCNS